MKLARPGTGVVLPDEDVGRAPSHRRVQFWFAHMRQNGKSRSPSGRASNGSSSSRSPANQ